MIHVKTCKIKKLEHYTETDIDLTVRGANLFLSPPECLEYPLVLYLGGAKLFDKPCINNFVE